MQVSLGKNITIPADSLNRISLEKLANLIQFADDNLVRQVNQLRTVLTIDPKKYRQLKTQLPYFTCGMFNPSYRKMENFSQANCFVLDFDHLIEKGITTIAVKQKIIDDKRVALAFVSPSNDGVKVIFCLKEPLYDHAKFSIFYKAFALKFAKQYGLDQVVDGRTSDVTRACFLSVDHALHFNGEPELVEVAKYVDFDSYSSLQQVRMEFAEVEQQIEQLHVPPQKNSPSEEALLQIRQTLNPTQKVKAKSYYVPHELELKLPQIQEHITNFGISIESIRSISYGKQMKFVLGDIWAELNVFYGSKGYSIVKSTKNGSHSGLTDTVHQILTDLLL